MNLVPRGSVSVDPDSHLRGASLAQSGMADQNPCIPASAYAIAAGIQYLTTSTTTSEFEQEDLILEDNGSPGVHGARLHGPGDAYPFMVTRTGPEEAAFSPRRAPAMSILAAKSANLAAAAANASKLLAGPAESDVLEHAEPMQRSSGAAEQPRVRRACHLHAPRPRAPHSCVHLL